MKISPLFRRLFIRRWLSTEAGPRPFPSPYNIGIDIAQISRYDEIVLNSQLLKYKESESPVVHTAEQPFRLDFRKDVQPLGSLEAYLRKTFNHVEWSIVRSKLLQYLNESTESWRLAKFLASR